MTPILSPKMLSRGHFLAKDLGKSAEAFKLGSVAAKIPLRMEAASGLATRIELRPQAAAKLGRKENDVEAAAAPIDDPTSVGEIRGFMRKLGARDDATDGLEYFLVTARRRKQGTSRATGTVRVIRPEDFNRPFDPRLDHIQIGRQVPIADTTNFILALDLKDKTKRIKIIPEGRQILIDFDLPLSFASEDGRQDEDDAAAVDTSTDEASREFAECYSECLNNVPAWLLGIVGGICTPCGAILAAAVVATTGTVGGAAVPSVAVVALVCTPCALAVGAVFGNCLLTCHEYLGD